jgi:hypothetical protein
MSNELVMYKDVGGTVKSAGFSIQNAMIGTGTAPMMMGTYGGKSKHKKQSEIETALEKAESIVQTKSKFGSHLAIPIGICLIREKQNPRMKCEVEEDKDVIDDDLYEKLLKLVEVKKNDNDDDLSSDSSSDEDEPKKPQEKTITKKARKTRHKNIKQLHKKTRRK